MVCGLGFRVQSLGCSVSGLGFRCFLGNIGIMEKIVETTIVYWGCIGIMENKMEATIYTSGFLKVDGVLRTL